MIEITKNDPLIAPTVGHQFGCLIFKGSFPLKLLKSCARFMPKDSFLDADAARVIGASAVIGNAQDILVLRENMHRISPIPGLPLKMA